MRARRKSELIKGWALEEGFDLAGVAVLGPSPHRDAVGRWLERGDHASMSYLERRFEERVDPSRLLEGAASALCVGLQYHPLYGQREPAGDLWSGVARYAHGEDYHLVMERRLRRLGERIETAFPGSRSRAYVDTGPILERELAARAGLGAVGKNTVLLHPERGSWLVLGELLLTLELAGDRRFDDLCGSCTACLEACPTGALPEAYRLDSRRCISYWTIEHRGTIPEPMRHSVGEWVFGCDVCQQVCPVNESVSPAAERRFELPEDRRELDLTALLGLSRDEYLERFRRSPMKRARLEGLQRNAATVMGNRRHERYVEPLVRALRVDNPAVRHHAAWALARIGGDSARRALESAREDETDPGVSAALSDALKGLAGPVSP